MSDRSGFSEVQVSIPLLEIRKLINAKWGKLDLSVKLGDYRSNQENARYNYYSQRLCRLLPHSISMPFEFRYLSQGRLEFVETCAVFPAILATYGFVSSIGVSHKLDSGMKRKVSTTRSETGEDCDSSWTSEFD